jgi:hypothetical protein
LNFVQLRRKPAEIVNRSGPGVPRQIRSPGEPVGGHAQDGPRLSQGAPQLRPGGREGRVLDGVHRRSMTQKQRRPRFHSYVLEKFRSAIHGFYQKRRSRTKVPPSPPPGPSPRFDRGPAIWDTVVDRSATSFRFCLHRNGEFTIKGTHGFFKPPHVF